VTKKKPTKCSNVGCVPENLVREMFRAWEKEQRRVAKLPKTRDGFTSYLAMVPAPPPPNTPVYYACINAWMMAAMKASELDRLYQQEAQLKATRLAGEGMFATLIQSYLDCVQGFPT